MDSVRELLAQSPEGLRRLTTARVQLHTRGRLLRRRLRPARELVSQSPRLAALSPCWSGFRLSGRLLFPFAGDWQQRLALACQAFRALLGSSCTVIRNAA